MSTTKTCKNTGKIFTIRDEDFEFYKKISPVIDGKIFRIPEPTLAPSERERRRLAYRNERKLYKRKSSLTGKEMISVFRPDSPFKIFTQHEWWSDTFDPLAFGQEYDFNKAFFDQFYSLQLKIPRPPLINNKVENSDYCNFADSNKNCYLCTSANNNEDCFYSFLIVKNRNCAECIWCTDSELLHECLDCQNCYNCSYLQNSSTCTDCLFSYNLKGCNNCLFCANLQNQNYCIKNKKIHKRRLRKRSKKHFSKTQIGNINSGIRKNSDTISSQKICKFNVM